MYCRVQKTPLMNPIHIRMGPVHQQPYIMFKGSIVILSFHLRLGLADGCFTSYISASEITNTSLNIGCGGFWLLAVHTKRHRKEPQAHAQETTLTCRVVRATKMTGSSSDHWIY
jgi:hypothetical protein